MKETVGACDGKSIEPRKQYFRINGSTLISNMPTRDYPLQRTLKYNTRILTLKDGGCQWDTSPWFGELDPTSATRRLRARVQNAMALASARHGRGAWRVPPATASAPPGCRQKAAWWLRECPLPSLKYVICLFFLSSIFVNLQMFIVWWFGF